MPVSIGNEVLAQEFYEINYTVLSFFGNLGDFIPNKTRHLIGWSVEQPSIASPDWSVI